MKTIATLDSSVRLVVLQFLMKLAQVPAIIPPKRASNAPPPPRVSGVQVLESTPSLNIAPLTDQLVIFGNYQLVDVWQHPHEEKWNMSFVRFVFCRKEHVKQDELFPDFVAQKYGLEEVLSNMVTTNLWATQGHLNPYFDKDGSLSGHKVLMLGCAGRVPNTLVFSGGRDENNRGVGPKVLLSTLCLALRIDGCNVVLVAPEPVPIPLR